VWRAVDAAATIKKQKDNDKKNSSNNTPS